MTTAQPAPSVIPQLCTCDDCVASNTKVVLKNGEIRTQKAKGIMKGLPALNSNHPYLHDFIFPMHYLIQNEDHLNNWKTKPCKYFARPCPEFPKHGFVESRPIDSYDKLCALFAEVVKEDPHGEVLLGPHFPHVDFNAIYTDFGSLSIGPGNDGATGGKGSIQLTVAPSKLSNKVKEAGGIKEGDGTYFEVVYASSKPGGFPVPNMVQMRGGPIINAAERDFIPEKTVVTNVIIPNEDLLVWAKQVENLVPGTAVWGDGHTLASHAAVHCIIHKIPFITTHKPEVGEALAPSVNAKQKPMALKDFQRGVATGIQSLKVSKDHMKDGLIFSLSVLHNWAYIRNSENAAYLFGAAIALMEKICSSLVLGEYRHAKNSAYYGKGREDVYERAVSSPGFTYLKKMKDAFESFHNTKWKSGFGGDPWAMCAFYSIKLWNATAQVYNKKTNTLSDKDIASIMDLFNGMINLSHNNGWWFNKIAGQNSLDMAAKLPGLAAAHSAVFYLNVCEQVKSVVPTKTLPKISIKDTFFMDKTKGACFMFITKDRLSWATFKTQKGFKRSTKFNTTEKQLEGIREKMKASSRGRIYLTPNKNGSFKLGNKTFTPPCKLEAAK